MQLVCHNKNKTQNKKTLELATGKKARTPLLD